MAKPLIAILFLTLIACKNIEQESLEIPFFENQDAQWITDASELPAMDSLFYLDHPAPLFRREFETDNTIEKATLFITAAGYYHAYLNGVKIGKNALDPAWTDFKKRIYYTEYDVKELIDQGQNCLGVSLGNGFYNPLPLRKWGRRNLRTDTHVGKPVFLAKLIISFKDGRSVEIASDSDWKYAYGPMVKNSVYLGIVHDAKKELDGWNTAGYDADSWMPIKIGSEPGGNLEKAFFPPVQITREITPISITSPAAGIWVVDMGENFTGTYKMKLSGSKGDTINFRFGERLYGDGSLNPMTTVIGQIKRKGVGGLGAPEIAWQTDSYIFGDQSTAAFSPEFTYHVYRYMEIEGLSYKPKISDIRGLFMNSSVTQDNNFSSSSALLNTIQKTTERTFLSNLISVQSDCPAREKFGYGGDVNATSESYIYNYDMQNMYRKTIYDWVDAMKDSSFVDTAPFAGVEYCGISWESAFLITQHVLYQYYNDTDIIEEMYALNKQWMDKVAHIHPDGMVEQGLSDHESLEPVPVQLTGTCHYLQCARIMETFASVMGDEVNKEKYTALALDLKEQIREKFWGQPVEEDINRQTLFSALLYHGIVPADEIQAAIDSLFSAVQNGPSGHFNTGIFGTKYVLETMSDFVSPQAVFDIVNSTQYPGWGHMIDRGATTIWETWKESDNTYSNNHPMFGTVTEWYYRWLAGVRPDPAHPGFEEFILAPYLPDGLDYVNCNYHTPLGEIISNWKKDASGIIQYQWTVPRNATARVELSLNNSPHVEVSMNGEILETDKIIGLSTGQFNLAEGSYIITVSP